MSSFFTKLKIGLGDFLVDKLIKNKDVESLPKFQDNGKGFFGLNALDIDGNTINFEKDLKDQYKAFLVTNVASD